MEKMPSASNSPMMGRKTSSEAADVKKTQPLSVASMVRRFERDNGLDKNRGGELERSNSSLNKIKSSPMSSRTSSLSSSQGHLASTEVVEASDQSVSTATAASTKKTTTSNKTVRIFKRFYSDELILIFFGFFQKQMSRAYESNKKILYILFSFFNICHLIS